MYVLLCMRWNSNEISISLVSFSKNHIYGDVYSENVLWCCVGINGWPISADKHKTWILTRNLNENSVAQSCLEGISTKFCVEKRKKEGLILRGEL